MTGVVSTLAIPMTSTRSPSPPAAGGVPAGTYRPHHNHNSSRVICTCWRPGPVLGAALRPRGMGPRTAVNDLDAADRAHRQGVVRAGVSGTYYLWVEAGRVYIRTSPTGSVPGSALVSFTDVDGTRHTRTPSTNMADEASSPASKTALPPHAPVSRQQFAKMMSTPWA